MHIPSPDTKFPIILWQKKKNKRKKKKKSLPHFSTVLCIPAWHYMSYSQQFKENIIFNLNLAVDDTYQLPLISTLRTARVLCYCPGPCVEHSLAMAPNSASHVWDTHREGVKLELVSLSNIKFNVWVKSVLIILYFAPSLATKQAVYWILELLSLMCHTTEA